MKMRRFKQHKLWRDKLIEMMERNYGSRVHWRKLDDAAFDEQLKIKLVEEAREVGDAQDYRQLINELADVYEVIDTLIELHQITKKDILQAQVKKREERGGFSARQFVELAEHPVGSFGEKYCLADPEKYPEVSND